TDGGSTRRKVGLVRRPHRVDLVVLGKGGDRRRPRVITAREQVPALLRIHVVLAVGGRGPGRRDDLRVVAARRENSRQTASRLHGDTHDGQTEHVAARALAGGPIWGG